MMSLVLCQSPRDWIRQEIGSAVGGEGTKDEQLHLCTL